MSRDYEVERQTNRSTVVIVSSSTGLACQTDLLACLFDANLGSWRGTVKLILLKLNLFPKGIAVIVNSFSDMKKSHDKEFERFM